MEMIAMMMSCQDSGAAADGAGGFLDMFGDLHSSGSGDLFELVWQAAGGGPACRSCTTEMPQAAGDSGLSTSSLPPSDDQPRRPSEDEMAAWLRAIVRGDGDDDDVKPPSVVGLDKPAGGGVAAGRAVEDDDQPVAAPAQVATAKTEAKCTDTGSNCSHRRKQRGRRFHHSEIHNLTEKRRRSKINEKFKTLQQLVPGCDNKSNQTSTLEQTIKHMKSLQHLIQQAMTFGYRIDPAASAAVYPVVMPPPPYYLPPPPSPAAAAALPLPPPTAFAPGVLIRGGHHVWAPGVVLGPPPPAMPFPLRTTRIRGSGSSSSLKL